MVAIFDFTMVATSGHNADSSMIFAYAENIGKDTRILLLVDIEQGI